MKWGHRRSQEFVLGSLTTEAPKRDAKVVEGGGFGEGVSPSPEGYPYPPSQPTTGGLGERCKLPQRGPGQSPGRKTSFGVFRAFKNTQPQIWTHRPIWHFCGTYLVTFTITKHKTFTYIFVHFAQLKRLCKFFPLPLGAQAPCPLWLRLWMGWRYST